MLYFILCFVLTMIIGYPLIQFLRKYKLGQEIREEGPKSHYSKKGTPTMGGIMFILSFVLVSLIYAYHTKSQYIIFILISSLLFGFTGFIDDYSKIINKRNLGLTAKQKYAIQLSISIGIVLYSYFVLGINTEVYLPFLGNKIILPSIIYFPVVLIMLTGTTNGVNLSDGLDGLCSGVSIIVLLGISYLAKTNGYMDINELSLILASALIAFLFYNFNPAKIFMGDTGSLFLGGFFASVFLVMQIPFHLIFIGLFYVIEALSVIIQVLYYKKTKKRFFLMAPIHHHFEMKGLSEKKVVLLSYIFTAVVVIFTVIVG